MDAARRYLMCECVEAYLGLDGPHLEQFEHLLQTTKFKEAVKMVKTSYEKVREEQQIRTLKRQLPKRFGPITDSIWKQIESMSIEQREQLAEDMMTAESLEQLGLGKNS